MIVPGPRNALTDVRGLLVGNAADASVRTGVTVILPEAVAVTAAVDVRGGAPGTINTTALAPGGLVDAVHGLVLAGGSAFGLEAACGLTNWLAARGRGFGDWGPVVPVVAGAILFDLVNGGDKDWGEAPPYRDLACRAADAAGHEVALGNSGAGYGAMSGQVKGGLGTASAYDSSSGITIGALVIVNSVGSVTVPGTSSMWAWHLEQGEEAGGQLPPDAATGHRLETKRGIAMNTTLGVIATDAALDRTHLQRLAVAGQDGLAYAIRPIHTLYDGDTVFALATGHVPLPAKDDAMVRLGAIAADVMARAVMRGVYAADDLGEIVSYRSRRAAGTLSKPGSGD
ncbi:MAG: P1 family peptidase [Geminicoccaceae bacterium]